MTLEFTKMHGCGNDYIYFDCFKQNIDNPNELSEKLSDRHFSIGGDGIVLICPSDVADGKMRMFNADGSEGKMCGNAIRCVAKYMYDNDIARKDIITIETLSGIKTISVTAENGEVVLARVDMGKAEFVPENIPVKLNGDKIVSRPYDFGFGNEDITCVSMGNPHCVIFRDDVEELDLEKIGPSYENAEIFPERINTEFVKIIDDKTLRMRVWERGSGETLACGTGACATVAAAVLNGHCKADEDIKVILTGGELIIRYTKDAVFMTGPCKVAFCGTVEV